MNYKSKRMKEFMFLITFGIILMWFFYNFDVVLNIGGNILGMLKPFIIGFGIAYLFNRPMVFIEKKLLKKLPNKWRRPLSYLLTLILFILIIFTLLFMAIPELVDTVEDLANQMPKYISNLENFAETKFGSNPQLVEKIKSLNWESFESKAISSLQDRWKSWAQNTFSFASSIIGSFLTFGLAFVFSVYALLEKEKLILQTKELLLAALPERIALKFFHIGRLSDEAFGGFLSGKLRESLVIITLFFVVMKIFKFPYALLISSMIGILTLIPWFGAFIGFALSFLLILVVDIKMAFWFIVVFTALYHIEGDFIYPIVVGKASGLSSIWIFVAGIIGGSIGGLAGILLSIPIFSVLATLLSEWVNKRLKSKNISDISNISDE
ncbi:MAG TPA: AI-2E family transporter [Tissierellaceae bacterium]|nr:AI-2E family transporter [Tissierellaceae bacterium]